MFAHTHTQARTQIQRHTFKALSDVLLGHLVLPTAPSKQPTNQPISLFEAAPPHLPVPTPQTLTSSACPGASCEQNCYNTLSTTTSTGSMLFFLFLWLLFAT